MSLQTRFDQLEKDIASQREKNKDWILKNECNVEEELNLPHPNPSPCKGEGQI